MLGAAALLAAPPRRARGLALALALLAPLFACAAAARSRPGGAADGPEARGAAATRLPPLSGDLVRQVLDLAPFRYRVASSSGNRSVTLWAPGAPRRRLLGHSSPVAGLLFFPFGGRLLTWGDDARALIWSVARGEVLREFQQGAPLESAAISPGGRVVATCGLHCAVWDAHTGRLAHVLETGELTEVQVFPSGERLLSLSADPWVTVWDLATGEVVWRMQGHNEAVHVAQIFPEGDRVITGSSDNKAIIWNASSGSVLHEIPHMDWVCGVAVLGGGEVVATATVQREVSVWSAGSGHHVRTLLGQRHAALCIFVGLSPFPDSSRLVTYTFDEAIVWNTLSGEVITRLLSPSSWISTVAVAPGGDIVVACGGGVVLIWDAASGALLSNFSEEPEELADNAFSCRIAIGLGEVLSPEGFGRGLSWRELPSLTG